MKNLKISIVIAVYNGGKTLQNCINSITSQNYTNRELIIIDGGSSDETLMIIEKNKNNIKEHLSEPDSGIYDAWNKGLEKASGEWIYFLGADDHLATNSILSEMAAVLSASPKNINIIYGQVVLINGKNEEISIEGNPWLKAKKNIFTYMTIPHQGVFHRSDLFNKIGKFDSKYKIAGDYEFILRSIKISEPIFINKIICRMAVGGVSNKPENHILAWDEYGIALKDNNYEMITFRRIYGRVKIHARNILNKIFGARVAGLISDGIRQLSGESKYWTK